MNRLIILIILFPSFISAQIVSNVTSRQNSNMIDVMYKLSDVHSNQTVKVNLYFSVNNLGYIGPLKEVSGDIGEFVSGNGNKKITWDVISELGSLEGQTKFKVEIIPNENYEFPSSHGVEMKGKIINCSLTGSTLTIDLVFESENDKQWVFYADKAAFFDEYGNQRHSSTLKIGNNSSTTGITTNLMKGVPVRIQYIFTNVPVNLSTIAGLEIRYHYNQFPIQFRNIPVIKK